MVIIVNAAFEGQQENSDEHDMDEHVVVIVDADDDDADDGIEHDDGDDAMQLGQEIEMALLNGVAHLGHTDASSSNEMNESTNDTEDTSDNNTTANTQTTAECDDRLLMPTQNGHHDDKRTSKQMDASSGNDEDDDSKENYDMNDDDAESNSFDGMKRIRHDAYDAHDIQCIGETEKLVGAADDCDYYGQNGVDVGDHVADKLKINHNGDGIIANHFIGLYSIDLHKIYSHPHPHKTYF